MSKELAIAKHQAEAAKERLMATLRAIQLRLKPAVLARDAADEIKDAGAELGRIGVDRVKRHPLPAIGAAALVLAVLARRPIARLFDRKSEDA
ncbi:hypothetical protein [uncultured Sphingomonas sp.]|uniref:hypothetical protein n=1 Tax=uncultured Sphingomonas sp. TaxID=158754 RepID=UPI0035CC710B